MNAPAAGYGAGSERECKLCQERGRSSVGVEDKQAAFDMYEDPPAHDDGRRWSELSCSPMPRSTASGRTRKPFRHRFHHLRTAPPNEIASAMSPQTDAAITCRTVTS
jgi:hypothetical protein